MKNIIISKCVCFHCFLSIGGDEWMANPAWKKTAERMVTQEAKNAYVNSKPTSTLSLDWVVRHAKIFFSDMIIILSQL